MTDAPPVAGHLCAALIGDGPQRCNRDPHDDAAHRDESRRLRSCLEAWPECWEGEYNPSCCRFPKSCSADVYDPRYVTPAHVEAEDHFGIRGVPSSSGESSGPADAETARQPGAVRPDAPVAPGPEHEDGEHGLVVEELVVVSAAEMLRRYHDAEPDQPPEVDESAEPGKPGSLPPVDKAAERVTAFIVAFGDGMILGRPDGLPPLFARDLEVLARTHDPNRRR